VQWGTPDQIYYRPRTPFVADFVGSVNLVSAVVMAVEDGRATVEIGGEPLCVALGEASAADGEVLLSVRPESLRLAPRGAVAEGFVALPADVTRHTFLGHLMRY